MMMTVMARRFVFICLALALFAVGLWTIVDAHKRVARSGQFNAAACVGQDVKCLAKI